MLAVVVGFDDVMHVTVLEYFKVIEINRI